MVQVVTCCSVNEEATAVMGAAVARAETMEVMKTYCREKNHPPPPQKKSRGIYTSTSGKLTPSKKGCEKKRGYLTKIEVPLAERKKKEREKSESNMYLDKREDVVSVVFFFFLGYNDGRLWHTTETHAKVGYTQAGTHFKFCYPTHRRTAGTLCYSTSRRRAAYNAASKHHRPCRIRRRGGPN